MKLATYKDGSRDGQLVVVSRDLSHAHFATGIATRLQQALDDWNFIAPQLTDLSVALNHGKARHAFAFDPAQCMAPLPRAYQWAAGPAYPSQGASVRETPGADVAQRLPAEPPMYRGASDDLLGPCDPALFDDTALGIDFEAAVAVVTGDVAAGATPEQALEGVRLVMLANDWSLRELIPGELAKGLGFVQGKPATTFGPVAVTPDELGDAWRAGRVHLPLQVTWNGRKVAHCDAAAEMAFHFGELVAHLAKTRGLRAGAIVGGGTVGSADETRGFCSIARKRALELAAHGEPRTGWLQFGDVVRIEMTARDGQPMFGALEQQVLQAGSRQESE